MVSVGILVPTVLLGIRGRPFIPFPNANVEQRDLETLGR